MKTVNSEQLAVSSVKKAASRFLLFTAYCLLLAFCLIGKESLAAERVKVAILPWKINAEESLKYLKGAVNDMLASRIGAEQNIEIIKESSVKSAIAKYTPEAITEDIAASIGKEVGADYVVFGSITVIAESVSIDARTIALKKAAPPASFASQSKGLGNLISLVDEMAKDAKARILNAEGINTIANTPAEPSPAYTGKFIAKEKPAADKTNQAQAPAETLNLPPKSLIGGDDDFIIAEKANTKGVWKSPQFPTAMKHIEIADVDGDKKNEIIMIDRHNLFIYRFKGQDLEMVKEFKGDLAVENYNVSIADMNNNGIPEIYVTKMAGNRLNSYVLEYKDGEFKTIASDLKWFLRVVKDPKTGLMLIGQKYSDATGFFGTVQKLEWKDGKVQETKGADIPKGLNLYNFEMADFDGNGTTDIIALDERDHLHTYSKDKNGIWEETWKSGEFYGGSLNRLELGATSTNQEASDYIDIKARIIYADLDGSGAGEMILSSNNPGIAGRYFKVIRSYDSGEIIDMAWEGNGFEEKWRTKKIDGYIADYSVADIDNDSHKELAVLVVRDGGAGKSYIAVYKLQGIGKRQ